ncbi:MAG: hypothetical protein ABSE72_08260 [Bacteroidales bacterium]
MKKYLIILALIFPLFPCCGQRVNSVKSTAIHHNYFREIPKNSLYIELLGNAYDLGSLNYEKIIIHKNSFYLSGRIGFGYGIGKPGETYRVNLYTFPVLLNGLFQVSNNFLFELGIGSSLSYANWSAYHPSSSWIVIGTPHDAGNQFYPFITVVAGIRVQSENGFIFRLGFTPLIQVTNLDKDSRMFFPWGGISFGYSF